MGSLDFPYKPAVTLLVLSFSLSWFIVRKRFASRSPPLPPGPKGLPILGSALEINKNEPWLAYAKWKESYGEIVSCKLLGQVYIILNSERVARALLDQRSSIYSDRPVIQTSRLFGMHFVTAHLSSVNPSWRTHRKMFHQTLHGSIIPKYYDSMAERARALLSGLLRSPKDFEGHMDVYSSSIIMSITYGYDVAPEDDPFVTPLTEMIDIALLTTPERAILLNFFPRLADVPSWFPGAEFQRLARRCQELSPQVRDGPVQFVKECLSKNIENESMVAQLLRDENVPPQDRAEYEQNIKDCAASSLIAGTDTTRSALSSIILALVLFPEVQDRAQAQIDSVVGRDRLPNFDDAPSLPYIDALIRETMRWASLVPMGIPHMVTRDDIFEQYLIPRGSVVIANAWGMARNEEKFPDPLAFEPERHLDADGNLAPDDTVGFSFGYGRRVCPGRYLANASVWLGAVNMLAVFRFGKAIDGATGREVDVLPEFTQGVARRPVAFSCRITPRFEEVKALLD